MKLLEPFEVLQNTNQQELRIEKVINKKIDKLCQKERL